jgi:hypothetical protein
MPTTLVMYSFVLWTREVRISFFSSVINNGAAIYVAAVVPAAMVSVIHARILKAKHTRGSRVFLIVVGGLLGLLIPGILYFPMLAAGSATPWGLVLWGVTTGGLFGAVYTER